MSIEIFSREALYTATRGLDNAFRALFPDGDSNPVIWQFTPHDAWKRTNWEFNPVTFYDDCIVDGKMVWGNVGVTYHVLHEWHTGHKVDSRCRYWRFLAGPDRGPLAPLLAKIHKLGRLRKHLRRCLHITRQIMKKVIGATPAELQFASAIHHIEWAPWVAERKLRRLPVEYSPNPLKWSPVHNDRADARGNGHTPIVPGVDPPRPAAGSIANAPGWAAP
jgi:hypothetical protein